MGSSVEAELIKLCEINVINSSHKMENCIYVTGLMVDSNHPSDLSMHSVHMSAIASTHCAWLCVQA